MAKRTQVILAALLLAVLAVAAFSPAFRGAFLWDDDILLYKNSAVTQPAGIYHIFLLSDSPDYFPLTTLSFYLEYRVFGPNPFPYHLDNLLLHIASGLLFWRLLDRLRVPGAYLAALLFVIHPVAVESVAWIAERKNTLSIFFFLLTVLAYVRTVLVTDSIQTNTAPQRRRAYVLALACFLLALLAKTSVVMLPFILLLLQWWMSKRPRAHVTAGASDGPAIIQRPRFAAILPLLPFFALSLALGLVTMQFQGHYSFPPSTLARSAALRVAQAGVSVWFYLFKALLPLDLATFYPEWQLPSASPVTFIPLILLVALLAILWRYRRRSVARNILFALTVFLLTLLPVLGLVNMTWTILAPVADHFQYLGLLAITPLLAAALAQYWPAQIKSPSANISSLPRLLAATLTFVIPTAYLYLTFLQCGLYTSEATLWRFNVLSRPQSFAAHTNLGYVLDRAGDLPDAIQQWQIAVDLAPDAYTPHLSLGKAYLRLRNPAAALPEFLATLRNDPKNTEAYRDLGKCYFLTNRPQEALAIYRQILAHDPADNPTRFELAVLLEQTGNPQAAIDEYRTYLHAVPQDATAHYNLANCLMMSDQTTQAIAEYQSAVQLDPNKSEAYFNLASALLKSNNAPAAQAALAQARRLDPHLPEIPIPVPAESHPAR